MFKRFGNYLTSEKTAYVIGIIILVVLFGLIPLLWFTNGYIVLSEENFFINYANMANRFSSVWADVELGGKSVYALLLFPNFIIFKFLEKISISLDWQQKIYFLLIWLVASLCIYLISTNGVKNIKHKFFVFLAGASIYFFNFDVLYNRPFYSFKSLPLMLIPLLYFLSYKYMRESRFLYVLGMVVILLFFQSLVADPASYVMTVCAIGLPYIERLQFPSKKQVLMLTVFIASIVVYNIANFYIPIYYFDRQYAAEVLNAGLSRGFANSISGKLSDVLTFSSSWWRYENNGAKYYFSNFKYYDWFLVKIASYLPLIFLLSAYIYIYFQYKKQKELIQSGLSLISRKNYLNITVLFIILFLLFMLSKGMQFPLEYLNKFFFSISNYTYIFRDTRKFFLLTILVEFLLVAKFLKYIFKVNQKFGIIISMTLFISGFIYALPIFQNQMFQPRNSHEMVKYTDMGIPEYWYEVAEYINNSGKNCRIMTYPQSDHDVYTYSWYEHSLGNARVNLPFYLFRQGLITGKSYFLYSNDNNRLFDLYYSNPEMAIEDANVCFILVQNDTTGNTETMNFPDSYIQKRAFGNLDLYEYKTNNGNNKLYLTNQFHLADSSLDSLEYINAMDDIKITDIANNSSSFDDNFSDYIITPSLNISSNLLGELDLNWKRNWDWNIEDRPKPYTLLSFLSRYKEKFQYARLENDYDKINFLIFATVKRMSEARLYPEYNEVLLEDAFQSLDEAFMILKGNDLTSGIGYSALQKLSLYIKRAYWETGYPKFSDLHSKVLSQLNTQLELFECESICESIVVPVTGYYDFYINADKIDINKAIESPFQLFSEKNESIYILDLDSPEVIKKDGSVWFLFKNIYLEKDIKKVFKAEMQPKFLLIDSNWKNVQTEFISNANSSSVFHSDIPIIGDYVLYSRISPGYILDQLYDFSVRYRSSSNKVEIGILELYKESSIKGKGMDVTKFRINSIFNNDSYHCQIQEVDNESCFVIRSDKYKFSKDTEDAFIYLKFGDLSDQNIQLNLELITLTANLNPQSFFISSESGVGDNSVPSVESRNWIETERINNHLYYFDISESNENLNLLVFNEAYDGNWIIYKRNEKSSFLGNIYEKFSAVKNYLISADELNKFHQVSNGYANSWIIKPGQLKPGQYALLFFPGYILVLFQSITIIILSVTSLFFLFILIKYFIGVFNANNKSRS